MAKEYEPPRDGYRGRGDRGSTMTSWRWPGSMNTRLMCDVWAAHRASASGTDRRWALSSMTTKTGESAVGCPRESDGHRGHGGTHRVSDCIASIIVAAIVRLSTGRRAATITVPVPVIVAALVALRRLLVLREQ